MQYNTNKPDEQVWNFSLPLKWILMILMEFTNRMAFVLVLIDYW